MSFKDVSYLQLWQPFCLAEWHHLCNFGKGHYKEYFCEILNLDKWFWSMCRLKIFISLAMVSLVFSGAKPFVQFQQNEL